MQPQRVSAPPMQIATHHDIESQTSTCGKVSRNIARACGVIAAGILTWGTVKASLNNGPGVAVLCGVFDVAVLAALLASFGKKHTSVEQNNTPARSIECPTMTGTQFGATLAGLGASIGIPLIIAGAATHNATLKLAGGLTIGSGITLGLITCFATIDAAQERYATTGRILC